MFLNFLVNQKSKKSHFGLTKCIVQSKMEIFHLHLGSEHFLYLLMYLKEIWQQSHFDVKHSNVAF